MPENGIAQICTCACYALCYLIYAWVHNLALFPTLCSFGCAPPSIDHTRWGLLNTSTLLRNAKYTSNPFPTQSERLRKWVTSAKAF